MADPLLLANAVADLDSSRATVFSLATALRVLPVFQIYSEHSEMEREFRQVENGLRAIRAELHAAGRASPDAIRRSLRLAEDMVHSRGGSDDAIEELVVSSLATVIYALRCYLRDDPAQASQASISALDLVDFWAESEEWGSDDSRSVSGPTRDPRVDDEFGYQLRDAKELQRMDEESIAAHGIEIVLRAERESMRYLKWMESTIETMEAGGSPQPENE